MYKQSSFARKFSGLFLLWLCLVSGLFFAAAEPFVDGFTITPEVQTALDSISANSLRGHLSFIASDLLEGRDSPSRGLDLAAEYIAAQFRRAGLEAGGDDGYFQTANWFLAEIPMQGFGLECKLNEQLLRAQPDEVSFRFKSALQVTASSLVKVKYSPAAPALNLGELQGKVVISEVPDFMQQEPSRWEELYRQQQSFLRKLAAAGVALLISVERSSSKGDGPGSGWLVDPEQREDSPRPHGVPWVRVYQRDWVKAYDELPDETRMAEVSLRIPAPERRPVRLRNVIGVLRGSDPVLRETCILVTAHYDHVGVKPVGEGDRIYNGANDDGSGTVSVIELASALARLKVRPKRSLVFMALFGEEKGLLGSFYYARHPLFALEKTVANINLEVVGRTDGSDGVEKNRASLTGFDYSSVGNILRKAGQLTGVDVYKHERFSDAFFDRSDNRVFAEEGVPAHSLCSVFLYPDYHGVGDHWDKIDYANLERINRAVALGLWMIAEDAVEPRWNESNPKAAQYLKVWQNRRQR